MDAVAASYGVSEQEVRFAQFQIRTNPTLGDIACPVEPSVVAESGGSIVVPSPVGPMANCHCYDSIHLWESGEVIPSLQYGLLENPMTQQLINLFFSDKLRGVMPLERQSLSVVKSA